MHLSNQGVGRKERALPGVMGGMKKHEIEEVSQGENKTRGGRVRWHNVYICK
jgi:hypothetical protein